MTGGFSFISSSLWRQKLTARGFFTPVLPDDSVRKLKWRLFIFGAGIFSRANNGANNSTQNVQSHYSSNSIMKTKISQKVVAVSFDEFLELVKKSGGVLNSSQIITPPERKYSTLTPFQMRVYQTLLMSVPEGKVTTYQDLARAVHCKSNLAIGQALKRNPFAPAVPCHRVVRSDKTLGGFMGQTKGCNIEKKRKILEQEGVQFDDQGHVKQEYICTF